MRASSQLLAEVAALAEADGVELSAVALQRKAAAHGEIRHALPNAQGVAHRRVEAFGGRHRVANDGSHCSEEKDSPNKVRPRNGFSDSFVKSFEKL